LPKHQQSQPQQGEGTSRQDDVDIGHFSLFAIDLIKDASRLLSAICPSETSNRMNAGEGSFWLSLTCDAPGWVAVSDLRINDCS
jgi:hypothetical protein